MKSLFQDVKERLRFHVKKVQTHPFVVDNISRGRAHLLVLGTRLKNAVPTKQQARDFWKEHHHRMVYIATFFVVCAVTIHIRASADVSSVNLYSKTCTGGWENSQNAAGAPDVEIGGINFSAENSAHAVGNPSTMTCAGFSGDVPNGVIPKKFTVKISWTATADAIVSVAPDATTESSSTNLVQDDVENALPLPSIDSSDTAVSATTTDISASSTVASSTDMGNIATSSEETTATSDTTETPVGLEAGTPSQVTTPAPSDLPQQDFLEVKYTLDGTNWKTLGTINAANAKNISFEINDADMTKWTDLSNFQISLSTLLPDSQLPNIYVDSVYLEADYETIPQIIDPPKIILKDSTAVLDGKSDFSSDEDPTFTVTDPGLTTSDVQTLVDNNQAQVVEDVRGLIDVSGQSQTTTSTSDSFGVQKNIIDPVINTVQQSVQSTSGAVTSFLAPAVAEAANNSATIDQAQVLDSFGNVTDIPVVISDVTINGVDKQQISITKPERAFTPGKYTLKILLKTPQADIISQQDFTWGVLAINTDKSIYAPGDMAFLQMGVINNQGHTICDADLVLTITGPSGQTYPFATANNSIVQSEDCHGDTYVTTPDYSAYFTIPKEEGEYTLSLTATTDNGTRTIVSHIAVSNDVPFDVVRTGPSRIYPESTYPVTLQITPRDDWNGVVTEKVPSSFTVSPADFPENYSSVVTSDDGQSSIISWNLALQKGKTTTIGYYFNAPKISPEFYLLGPLSFQDDSGQTVFAESRQWQIADDAVCTAMLSGTWNTVNTGGMWSGCTGVGGVPAAADDVTINPSITVTLGVNTPTVNSITVNGTLDTSSISSFALNTKSLSVPLGGKLNANASTITVSGTSNSILAITGTFNTGSSTILITGGSTATTLPAVTYHNLTLNNSANTYLLTGTTTIDTTGALTLTSGTFDTSSTGNYTLTAGKISVAAVSTAITNWNASTVTLNGTSGTLFTKGANAITNASSSTFIINPDAAVTLFNFGGVPTLGNLILSPVLTTSRIYSLGTSFNTSGNVTVAPSGTGTLTISTGVAITIPATKTFLIRPTGSATMNWTPTPANTLSTGTIDVEAGGTFTGAGGAVTLTGTTGTPLINNGTVNFATSTVTFIGDNPSGNTTIPANVTYSSITLNNSTETYVPSGALTLPSTGILTVTNGTLDTTASNYALTAGSISLASAATAILNFNASTITLNGTSGILLNKGTLGVIKPGTSTLVVNPDAAITLFGTSTIPLSNLMVSPALTTNRLYATGVSFTATGNVTFAPSGTGTLTISTGVTITVAASKTFLLQPSGSATITWSPTAAGILSTGTLDIENNATFIGNTGAITLTGTTGTPLINNGTGNFSASTITFSGDNPSGNTTIPANVTYGSITLNNATETYVPNAALTLSTAGILTVTNGTFDTDAINNYSITVGKINLANLASVILNLNASTVTLNATSGTLFTKGTAAVLNPGTSTIVMVPDAAVTMFSGATTVYNLTLNPVLTTNRTYVPGTTGTLTTSGDFMINPSGSGTLSFTLTAGVTSLSVAAGKTLTVEGSGGASTTFDTSGSGQPVSAGTIDIEAGGTFNANQSTITLTGTTGTPFIMNGTFNAGVSTVAYTGDNPSGNTTIATTPTYYSINLNKTGETFVLGGTLTGAAAGTLTMTAGTFDTTSSNYAINFGHLNVGAAGVTFLGNNSTVTLNGTSGTLYTRNNSSTITTPNMDVVMTSDAAVTLFTAGGVYSFDNLTLSPALTTDRIYTWGTPTITINNLYVTPISSNPATLTVNMAAASITVASTGTFLLQPSGSAAAVWNTSASNPAISTGALDIESNGTFTANASVVTITGTSLTPFIMNGTFNQGTSTVTFTGPSTNAAIPAITFYNMTINKTGSMVLAGTTTVMTAATFTITSGTFDTSSSGNYPLSVGHIVMAATSTAIFNANGSTITLTGISGTLFNKSNTAVFNGGTSEVIVNSASGNPSLLVVGSNNCAFYKLTIDAGATVINAVGSIVMSNANAGNRLWIKRGVLSDSGIQITGTTNGTLQIDSAGTLCLGEVGATTATCNNSTSAGTTVFPTNYTNGNIILDPASTVYYNANTPMTISSVPTYGNLYIAPLLSSSRIYTANGPLNINGNLSIIPNTAAVGVFTATLNLGGATTVASNKTTLVQGGGASPVSALLDTTASNYAFSTGSLDVESSGSFTGRASTITIAGNWTNNGTFTPNTSSVIFNTGATSVVTGTSTFYKLTITNTAAKEVDFAASSSTTPVYSVTNLFTVTGQAGGLMKLRSVNPGTKWQFYPTGTSNVTYVDVQDGGCQAGAITITTIGGVNSGNNDLCWGFTPFITFSISSGTVGFGSLSSLGARYATSDGTGSSTDVEGNNITAATYAAGGYALTVQGFSLSYAGHTISGMGDSNITSIPGVEQFGIRAIATGGSGVVQAPYSGSSGTGGFATTAATSPSIIASESVGDGISTTYSMHYIANIGPSTPAGKYTTTLTYILTGTF